RSPPLPAAPVALIVPDFGVNTGEAYAALAARRADQGASAGASWRSPRTLGAWSAIAADAVNDFESVIFEQHPALATLRAQLAALPRTVLARMSGSGSTLFAVQERADDTAAAPGRGEIGLLALPSGWQAVHTTTAPQLPVEFA
ncbi:MAG: 4-(cytidine 5'-diphospho)-2-C-methyl-D-erythritol kinase, partial [Gemmatimonadaceae bacterium]